MALPHRVNLVYDAKWSLAKLGYGRCAAEVERVETVMKRKAWKTSDYRWSISEMEDTDSGDKTVSIRSDVHPRRILTGGIPPMLEDISERAQTKNHSWYFEFAQNDSSLFHIRSCLSDMYLVVSEEGQVLLDCNPPEVYWRWHDATRKYKKFTGAKPSDSEMKMIFAANLSEPSSPPAPTLLTSMSSGDSPASSSANVDPRLSAFAGEAVDAFEILRKQQREAGADPDPPLTPLREVLTKEVFELCNDTSTLLPASCSESFDVEDIFPALFANPAHLRRFQERRNNKDVHPVLPRPMEAQGLPWGAVASLTCKAHLPVLGMRDYRESQRMALCRTQEGELTLIVQTAGTVHAGYVGNFTFETVFFFSQSGGKGNPIRFRAIAVAPGSFKSQFLDGQKKSLADFVAAAQETLQDWTLSASKPPLASVAKEAKITVQGAGAKSVQLAVASPEAESAIRTRTEATSIGRWLALLRLDSVSLRLRDAVCCICPSEPRRSSRQEL